MRDDAKVGLAAVALIGLCCGGPLLLSLLASGVVLGALGSVWAGGRLLLLGSAALLIAAAAWILLRRRARAGAVDCDLSPPQATDGARARGPTPTVGHRQ